VQISETWIIYRDLLILLIPAADQQYVPLGAGHIFADHLV